MSDDLVARLRQIAAAYPDDIFTPVSVEDQIFVRENRPGLIDRCSAAMGRHLSQFFVEAAAALEAKDARIAELERDIDLLEACIRDGSYASILNDIVAVCQHSYSTIGPGPALRSAIDAAIAAQEEQT